MTVYSSVLTLTTIRHELHPSRVWFGVTADSEHFVWRSVVAHRTELMFVYNISDVTNLK